MPNALTGTGSVAVASASQDYATLAVVKARLGITDATDDSKLSTMITAISRAIDEHCCRHFYVDAANATRYFTAEFADVLYPGDLVSVATLATDSNGNRDYTNTWTSTDYDLLPYDADDWYKPYTQIATTPQGNYAFTPGLAKGVKIVGKWGWPAVPAPVSEACILMCEKLFLRRDAIFGVVGSAEVGTLKQVMKEDPEINLLLQPYVKMDVMGI